MIYSSSRRTASGPADVYDFEKLAPGQPGRRTCRDTHADHDHCRAERADRNNGRIAKRRPNLRPGNLNGRRSHHILDHSPPAFPRCRRGGDHVEACLGQRDYQRGPRPHGLALPGGWIVADGGRRISPPPDQRGRGLQGDHSPFRGAHQRGRRLSAERSLYSGAAHVGHLPGGADPPRRQAGRVERLLRPCLRHRRQEPRRLLPRCRRHLHRGLQLSGRAAGQRRRTQSGRARHAAQHGAFAGDGHPRHSLDDRLQQRCPRPHARADRQVRLTRRSTRPADS